MLSLSTFALIACGGEDTPDTASMSALVADAPAAAPNLVDVSAGEFFYTMADTIAAGATTFRL